MEAVLDRAAGDGLPGVTATVLAAGRGRWSGAAGTADGKRPMEVSGQFGIASITKTVIAAEVLWLSDRHELDLDDKIADHLPAGFEFDANGATVRNLLSMESGIPDPTLTLEEVLSDPLRTWTPQQVLATVPAHRSPPGDHFVYEDANYMLLGLVIEDVTGVSVAKALRSGVLGPIPGSLVYQPEERPAGPLALPFRDGAKASTDGGGFLESRSEASSANGSGGMASDSGALAAFGYELFGRQMLSSSSLAAMTDFGSGPTYDRYGLGVFDQTPLYGHLGTMSVGNGGWGTGYAAFLAVLPSEGIVIAVLTNRPGDPKELVLPVAQDLALLFQD
jgi:D-alanyl-D-alanine carboxypeptidase